VRRGEAAPARGDSAARTPAPDAAPQVRIQPAAPEPSLRLRLNLPAYRLDVLESGARPVSHPVAVGMPEYPTPLGEFSITEVVWNPWWHPPDREWARGDTITPPCPQNPMGRVKLFFGELLYLHGTPAEPSLGHALSHGCVRLSNADAIAVARTVHRHGSPQISPSELDGLEADPRRTRSIRLVHPVPLAIVYETAEIRGDELLLHPDVYGLVEDELDVARRALAATGLPPPAGGDRRLREAVERADREQVAIPLRDLVAPP
jgi:murein L,D-transpeptidase YcbB/YkuD